MLNDGALGGAGEYPPPGRANSSGLWEPFPWEQDHVEAPKVETSGAWLVGVEPMEEPGSMLVGVEFGGNS